MHTRAHLEHAHKLATCVYVCCTRSDPRSQTHPHALAHSRIRALAHSLGDNLCLIEQITLSRREEACRIAVQSFGATLEGLGSGGKRWPGSVVLAQWLLAQPEQLLRGKAVVELGCGCSAVPGIIVARYPYISCQNIRTR